MIELSLRSAEGESYRDESHILTYAEGGVADRKRLRHLRFGHLDLFGISDLALGAWAISCGSAALRKKHGHAEDLDRRAQQVADRYGAESRHLLPAGLR